MKKLKEKERKEMIKNKNNTIKKKIKKALRIMLRMKI